MIEADLENACIAWFQELGYATEPEIGDVTAIIKQDGQESRAQIYSEYVA